MVGRTIFFINFDLLIIINFLINFVILSVDKNRHVCHKNWQLSGRPTQKRLKFDWKAEISGIESST